MKNIFWLAFLFIVLQPTLLSQTIFWEEDFYDSIPGWSLQEYWYHYPNKLAFDGTSAGPFFDYKAVSPIIEIDANASQLIINQYIEVWDFDADDGIAEIAIIDNQERIVVWNHDLSDGDWGWPDGTNLMLDMSEYQEKDIRIEFRTFGDQDFLFYNWRVFNCLCYTNFNNDLAVTNFNGPENVPLGQEGTWTFTVTNLGLLSQDAYSLSLIDFKSGEVLKYLQISELLGPTQEKDFDFQWTATEQFNSVFYVQIGLDSDDFQPNNKSSNLFIRLEPEEYYNIFVWDNDNEVMTIYDPETGEWMGAEEGITRALQNAGIAFDLGLDLPDELLQYEIIFCTLGPWCES